MHACNEQIDFSNHYLTNTRGLCTWTRTALRNVLLIYCATLRNMSLSRIPNVGIVVLLISLCLFSDRGFGTAETIVDTNPHVVLEVGTTGILPCRTQRRGYSVDWKRQLSSGSELLVSIDLLFDVGKRDGPGYEAGLFNITDDYSLVIKDVKVQDEGLYMCSFSDYQTGKPFQNSTRVSVQDSDEASSKNADPAKENMISDSKRSSLHGKYYYQSFSLDIKYSEADDILRKHNGDTTKAFKECEAIWMNRTGGSSNQLQENLRNAEKAGSDEASSEHMDPACGDMISDSILDTLSCHIPHEKYMYLCYGLQVNLKEANGVLKQHGFDFTKALRECLGTWKNRTGGSRTKLEKILCGAELGGCVKYLK